MNRNMELELKQKEFNASMALYDDNLTYRLFGIMVSTVNVFLQGVLLYLAFQVPVGCGWHVLSFAAAFVSADFVNGLVHIYMDNNDNYGSFAGPLVAAFHLHHKTPLYKKNNIFHVYFYETGSKVWLVPWLLVSAVFIQLGMAGPVLSHALAWFGILSSVAEVTHYRCHVHDTNLSKYFERSWIFLSKRHHGRHHVEDNVNYAFLNGITNPLLNAIASKFYPGYKETTDRHYALYTGKGTDNRVG